MCSPPSRLPPFPRSATSRLHTSCALLQVFVTRGDRLISCSKDGLVKVWDLATQHCSQTISGYKAEVWSLDLDPSERRLVTGEPAGGCI